MSTRNIKVPAGDATCQLCVLNTTCDIVTPLNYLVEPDIEGYEWLNLPTWSFHIKHEPSGRELLFDLGSRKDWENSVPHVRDLVAAHVNGYKVERNVIDILTEGGVDLDKVEALVLSHWHFDHCGAPSELPKSVKLVVGPGFKNEFMPGWPAKEGSPFHEADFEGREVFEPSFTDDFKVGQYQAYDYFGDGSFFVLNTPGHAVGHVSALVRTTTKPDTFAFLGGDICHHSGDIRPTKYIPMPENVPEETPLDKRFPSPCPCIGFLKHHSDQQNASTTPFFKISSGKTTFYQDPPTAQKSADALQELDAQDNIIVIIAHDPTTADVVPFFPKPMNDWKKLNSKKRHHWGFLNEMPYEGKTHRPTVTDGLYGLKGKIRGLQLS